MSAPDLPYDFEDFGLSEEELIAKYGDAGHPHYTIEDWEARGMTTEGIDHYWDWVMCNIDEDDDAYPGNTEDLVEVTEIGPFIAMLQAWHKKQVATLKHLTTIPVGTDVAIEDDDPFKLEGPAMQGFQMGISIALAHLGDLPFEAEFEEVDAPQP